MFYGYIYIEVFINSFSVEVAGQKFFKLILEVLFNSSQSFLRIDNPVYS